MKQFASMITRVWWPQYKKFIHSTISIHTQKDEGDVTYWREVSFVKIVTYLIPVSLIAFIPRIMAGFLNSQIFFPVFDITFYILLCTVLLNRTISAEFKKIFVVGMLYLFSLVLLLVQGAAGPAILYLTCTCIFTVFLFKGNKIYYSFLANMVIVGIVALLIHFQLFQSPLQREFDTLSWLNYASNLLFINIICLLLIQRIIRRLEKIIIKESELQGQLADEILERKALNNKLQESEDYYRYLFASNPIPMWVYDIHTLCFLQVNDSAVHHYGYSRDEFLSMTIEDIHPPAGLKDLNKVIKENKYTALAFKGISVHMKKKGRIFPVEIRSNPIEVNGKVGRLVLATDITERTRYVNDIEEQNKRLKHIAWIQSHKVRAPLARVMSLTDLLSRQLSESERDDIVKYLIISADELNEIVISIIKQAEAE